MDDNIIHFVSNDLNLSTGTGKLLTDIKAIYQEDLVKAGAEVREVICTIYRKRYVFSLVITNNTGDEHIIRSLTDFLRDRASIKQDYDKEVPFAMHEYNTFTGYAFELVYGRPARTPNKLSDEYELRVTYNAYIQNLTECLREMQTITRGNLIDSKYKNKQYYDKKARSLEIEEPKYGKLDKYYNGEFIVKEIRDNNNVIVESTNRKLIVKHKNKLEKFYK
ncbi:hypothetical protein TSAR_000276 [Trichomalopsis sarcophagae]|uniref:Uncharacterized protein n=1 Tax=Trichomalopsis sarcophagae TaxID=543379 RepID=A0A232EPA9_9HYME|nr:hypothetical protein TSAR_000276 [Trichomalopsis sarcophagae]